MIVPIVSLIFGLVIGYFGQRARLCYIAGYRDFTLVRDTYVLKGMLGTVVGAVGGFFLFSRLGGDVPGWPMLTDTPGMHLVSSWLFAIVGGLGLGFFACLSGGCPYRNHIMAMEGKMTFWMYALGFWIGLIYFNLVTNKFLDFLVNTLH